MLQYMVTIFRSVSDFTLALEGDHTMPPLLIISSDIGSYELATTCNLLYLLYLPLHHLQPSILLQIYFFCNHVFFNPTHHQHLFQREIQTRYLLILYIPTFYLSLLQFSFSLLLLFSVSTL